MAAHSGYMPKNKTKKMKTNKKLKDLSVDEFLMDDFDTSGSESSEMSNKGKLSKKSIKKQSADSDPVVKSVGKNKQKKKTADSKKVKDATVVSQVKSKSKKKDKAESKPTDKHSLASTIKDSDPEFYKFLKDEDKGLLTNLEDLSDSESDSDSRSMSENQDKNDLKASKQFEKELLNMSSGSDEDEDSEADESGDYRKHKLPQKLEVASDDEDDDSEDGDQEVEGLESKKRKKKGTLVTNKMIEKWSNEMRAQPSHAVLKQMISAFHAAVQEAGGPEAADDGEFKLTHYRVEGSLVFNSVVRMCLVHVASSLQTMLQIPSLTDTKQVFSDKKTARWKKLKADVRQYFHDLLDLITQLSEPAMIIVMLKHIHKLILLFAEFPKLSKLVMRKMIKLWTTGEETTRVLAFLCINKLVHLKQDLLLDACVKQMYTAYVSNCKFTSPTTLPLINFMQRSIVEIFNMDQMVAYQYAFIYIRQLAIHLRNAISVKKKNMCQAVYNWQYIHCLGLWVQLLTSTYPSPVLEPLVYPLTQTILGTVKLLPTARFYPLRFHCVKLLNTMAAKTNTFIPTLPFLLEVFELTDFNKRHKTMSLKPFNFAVILKFSKSQLQEKAFRDGLIDQLYEHLLEGYNVHAHSVGFPELIIPSVIQLKDFLKKCKVANYCKQIKQIVDKVSEQSKFIGDKRKQSTISLDNAAAVTQWEARLDEGQSPLRKYHTSWRKLRDRELMHAISNKDAISGAALDIPTIERRPNKKATQQEREDFDKLFENDSDSDDETRFLLKEERPKGKKRTHTDGGSSDSDMYSDFDENELEQLAQSADEDDEEEDDDDVEVDDDDDSEEEEEDEAVGKASPKKYRSVNPAKRQKMQSEGDEDSGEDVEDEVEDVEDEVEDFVMSDSD